MADNIEYLTQEKFDELKVELETLKTKRRKEVAENLEYAKSLGDLSENAEYQEAREMQASIEDRIAKLENIIKNAVIMSHKKGDVVDIGSTVTVEKDGSTKKSTFKLVGSEEADVYQGKLSIHSPMGQAMMGKKKGDNFSFTTPSGTMKYRILDVE